MKTIRAFRRPTGILMMVLLALWHLEQPLHAATLYWDAGGGATTTWTTLTNWNTAADGTGADPGAAPGASDTAIFNVSSLNTAQTATLTAALSIDGLVFNNTNTTGIRTDGTANRAVTLGAGGITINAGAGAVTFGTTTTNQRITFTLGAHQTWLNNSSTAFTLNANNTIATGGFTLTFDGTGNITTGTGAISGAGGIIKNGTGTVTLAGANTYTGGATINNGVLVLSGASTMAAGGVTLNGGTLRLGNNAALGATANKLTIAGGTVDVTAARTTTNNNGQNWNGDFTFAGTNTWHTGTGAVVMSASRSVTVSASVMSVGGAISGTGFSLTKLGAGTLFLGGANVYTGGTQVNEGALVFGTTVAKPSSGTTQVAANATLGLGVGGAGFFSSADVDALFANTLANVNLASGASVGIDTTAGDFNYATNLSSTRRLVKLGANVLTLSGTNSHTGGTLISNGTLAISSDDNLGDAAGALTIVNDGVLRITGTSFNTWNASRTLNLTGASGIDIGAANAFTISSNLTLGGGMTKIGAGTLILAGTVTGDANAFSVNAGVLQISGNATSTGTTTVGNIVDARGLLRVSTGGTFVTGNLNLGNDAAGMGALVVHGGTATVSNGGTGLGLFMGNGGYGGLFVTSGSTLNLGRIETSTSAASTALAVIQFTGGTVNNSEWFLMRNNRFSSVITAGTLDRTGASQNLGLAYQGAATAFGDFTVAGGLVINTGRNVTFGQVGTSSALGTGVLNLNAGTLRTNQILAYNATGAATTAVINFSGGTLQAAGATADFIGFNGSGGTTTLSLRSYGAFGSYAGGAVIDTNGFGVTLAQPIQAPTGNGVSSIPLSSGGTGYFGAPYVEISGGGGTGATGYATVDLNPASGTYGQVTGITITNPGVGYTSAPTVTLSGGGGVGAATGTVAIAANTSGGLTKTGDGTLTLTGVNTYSGATTVNGGSLSILPGALPNTSGFFIGAAGNGALDLYADGVGAAWNVASGVNITLGSATTSGALGFNLGTASDRIVLSGGSTLTVNGGGGLINVVALSGFGVGNYDIITGLTGGIQGTGTLQLGALPAGYIYSLNTLSDPAKVTLNVLNIPTGDLYWVGGVNNSWGGLSGSNSNWATVPNGSTNAGYAPGSVSTAYFSATNASTGPIVTTLDSAVSVAGLKILGSGTGAVTINPGTSGTLTIGSGGIEVQSGAPTPVIITAPVILGADQIWSVADAGSLLEVSGIVSGAGSLIKSGMGALTLSGLNTFTGNVTLNAGTLRVTTAGTTGLGTGAAALFLNGGELQIANSTARNLGRVTTIGGNVTITTDRLAAGAGVTHTLGTLAIGTQTLSVQAGSLATSGTQGLTFGAVTLSGAPTFTVNNNGLGATTLLTLGATSLGANTLTVTGSGNTTISGIISGTGGVIMNGTSSVLTLSGNNASFAGGVTILKGTVNATTSANALGTGILTLGSASANSSPAQLNVGTNSLTYSNPIVLADRTTQTGTLTLGIVVSTVGTTYSGGVTGNNDLVLFQDTTGGTGRIAFTVNPVNISGTVTVNGANTFGQTAAASISGGVGSNVTSLIVNNNFAGLTVGTTALTVNSGGTTLVNNATGGTVLLTVSGGVTGAGDLILRNNSGIANGITLSTSAVNNTGAIINSGTGTGTATISAVIGSSVTGISQNSATSQLTLSGNSSAYAGGITINAGTLSATTSLNALGSASNSINLGATSGSADATLNYGLTGTWTATPINVRAGSSGTLTIKSSTDTPVVAGAITLANNLTLSLASNAITFSGGITGTGNVNITGTAAKTLTIQTGALGFGGNLSNNFSGTGAGVVTISSAVNITGVISNNSTGTGTMTLSGVIGSSVTGIVQNSATSQLTLSGVNSAFAGSVDIKQGVLLITSNVPALGSGVGVVTLGDTVANASNAELRGNVAGTTTNNIVLASGTTGTLSITSPNTGTLQVFSGSITGNNNLTIAGTNVQGISFTGDMSFSGNLTAASTGAGAARISGISTYTGTTTVASGILVAGRRVSLYNGNTASWTASNLIVNSGATLAFNVGGTGEFTASDIDLLKNLGAATGGFKNGSNIGFDTTGGSFLYNGNITDTNGGANLIGLTKLGAGTLVLGGTNTYSGATHVLAGAIAGTISSSNLVLNGGVYESSGTFTRSLGAGDNQVQWVAGANGGFSAQGGSLTVTLSGGAPLTWNSTASFVSGSGQLLFGSTTSDSVVTFTNNIDLNDPGSAVTRTIQVLDNTGSTTDKTVISGVISGGANVTLGKSGAGVLELNGVNTYTGATLISGTGMLRAGNNQALGSSTVTIQDTAVLELADGVTLANAITISSTGSTKVVRLQDGALTGEVSGTITNNETNANLQLSAGAGGVLTVSGAISGANSGTGVQKTGAGTVILTSASNTYVGATSILDGILRLDGSGKLGAGALTVTAGTLQILNTGADQSVALLTMGNGGAATTSNLQVGSGRILTVTGVTYTGTGSGVATIGGLGTLNLGAAGITVSVADNVANAVDMSWEMGVLTGSGVFNKTGAGTLDLRSIGTNSFTGSYQVSAGAILGLDALNNNLLLNGGVYEGSGTFGRALGSGSNQVQWAAGANGGFAAHGDTLTVTLSSAPDPLVWNSTPFFVSGSGALLFGSITANDVVTFTHHIDLNGAARTVQVVDNTTSTADKAVLSGVLSSTGGITKTGNGVLQLTGANTFTGAVTVTAGRLEFSTVSNNGGAASNLGQGTNGISLGGGVLAFVGSVSQTTNRAVTLTSSSTLDASGTGGATITYGGTFTGASTTLTLTGSGEGFLNGALTQSGATADITKNGSGTWHLNATSTLADDILVNDGTLNINVAQNVFDDIVVTGAATVLNINAAAAFTGDDLFIRGSTVKLGANGALIGSMDDLNVSADGASGGVLDVNGTTGSTPADLVVGSLNFSGSVIDTVGTGSIGATGTFALRNGVVSANLTGAATMNKTTAATLTLSGNNTGLTGATNLSESGTLVLSFATNNQEKLSNGLFTSSGGGLIMNGNASADSLETIGGLTLANGSTRITVNHAGAQTATLNLGAITRAASGDGLVDFNTSANSFIKTSTTNTAGTILGGWATFGGSRFATVSGTDIIAVTTTVQDNVSLWNLGDNVSDSLGFSGTVEARTIHSLAFTAGAASMVTIQAGRSLTITSGGILVSSSVGSNAASIVGGVLQAGAGSELFVHQNNTASAFTIGSALTGTTALTKGGVGTLVLSGTNTYNGQTTIHEGTLMVVGGNAIGDASVVELRNVDSAVLDLNNGTETIGGLTGGAAVGGAVAIGTGTLTIVPTATQAYSGAITGSGVLIKNGSGTQQFLGNHSAFTGTVIINQGLFDLSESSLFNGATTFILNGAGELLGDQDVADVDHIGNNATIILNNTGSNRGLWIRNPDVASAEAETVGAIILGAGHNVIQADTNGGTLLEEQSITLTAASLSRTNHATLLIRGQRMDQTDALSRSQIIFTAAAPGAVGGGGAAGTTTMSILPYVIGEQGAVENSATLAARQGNSFVFAAAAGATLRPLSLTVGVGEEYVHNEAGYNALTGLTLNNVRFIANPGAALSGTASQINSLVLDSSATALTVNGPASALRIKSGAILATTTTAANAISLGGFTTLTTDPGNDFIIYVTNAANTFTLSSALASATPLVKSGAGTLSLTNTANAFTDIYLNQGYVQVDNINKLGTGELKFMGGGIKLAAGFTGNIGAKTWNIGTGGGFLDAGLVTGGYTLVDGIDDSTAGSSEVFNIFTRATGSAGADGQLTIQGSSTFTGTTVIRNSGIASGLVNGVILNGDTNAAISGNLEIGNVININDTFDAVVALGANEQIVDTASITFRGASGENAYFKLMGFSETVAGISDTTREGVIENVESSEAGVATNGKLTVNSSADFTYNAYLRNRASGSNPTLLEFEKQGTGTQMLVGDRISYSGLTTISGGTLHLQGVAAWSSSIVNNSVLILDETAARTHGQDITGTGSLIKTGSAALTFAGGLNLTYQGSTTVSGGTMTVGSTLNGSTSLNVINSGSTLALTGGIGNASAITNLVVENGGTLSLLDGVGNKFTGLTNLQLGSQGGTMTTLYLNVGDGATAGDSLNTDLLALGTGGTLSLFAGNQITLNITDAGLNPNQTYNLITDADGQLLSVLGSGDWLLGATPGGFTSIILNKTGGAISITTGSLITGALYWRGLTNTTWNGNVNNWSLDKAGASPATSIPGQGTDVIFQWDAPANAAVVTTLEQNFKINSLTFEASTTPANTPVSVTINPGTLATSRLEIAPQVATDGIKITAGGPASVTIATALRLGASQTWNVADAASVLTLSGALQGEADVAKTGAGKVTLTAVADPTFNTGLTTDVTVSAGTLEITNAGALGTTASSNLANVAINGGAFYYNGAAGTVANALTLGGGTLSAGTANQTYSGAVNVSADSFINMRDNNAAATGTTARSITLSGVLSGSGSLTIDSIDTLTGGNAETGTVTISNNANTWNGGLIMNRGTVVATAANGLGGGFITFNQLGRVILRAIDGTTYNLGGAMSFTSGAIGEFSVDNTGALASNFTVNQTGLLTIGSGSGSATVRFYLADTASHLNITGGVVLNANGSISVEGGDADSLVVISGTGISETGGSRSLAINDEAGTWGVTSTRLAINAAGSYSGGTTLNEGTLILGHKDALGTGGLAITGASTIMAGVDLSGTGSGPVANALTLTNNLTVAGSNSLTFSGLTTISGGNRTVTNSLTAGVLRLDTVNMAEAGTARVFTVAGTGSTVIGTLVNQGANNTLTSSVTGAGSVVIDGQVFLSEAAGTGRTLTINGAGPVHISGVVADYNGAGTSGGITYSGTGTLTLSGASTYTGATTVTSGTVQFNTVTDAGGGASSLGQGSAISIGAATLSFIGSTSQATNRGITQTGASIYGANGTGGASITYNGAINAGANNFTLTGVGQGIIAGGITQTGDTVDGSVTGGIWTHVTGTSRVADDFTVTGTGTVLNLNSGLFQVRDDFTVTANGVLNLNGAGVLSYNTPTLTSGTLRAVNGGIINFGANDSVVPLEFDELRIGTDADGAAGVLNMGIYNQTVTAFILGNRHATRTGTVNGTGTLTINGNIDLYQGTVNANLVVTGINTIDKFGVGTVTLSGDNSGISSTGAAILNDGTLVLDYTTSNTTKLREASDLEVRGGQLILNGNAAANTAQTVATLDLDSSATDDNQGFTTITLNAGAGRSIVLNLGTIARISGNRDGTLRFVLPSGTQSSTNGITTTSVNASHGLLSADSSTSAFATVDNGTGVWFATNATNAAGGNIVALISTTKNDVSTWAIADHITDQGGGFTGTLGGILLNSLRFDAAAGSDLNLTLAGALGIASGGILVTSNVGGTPGIFNGTLSSGSAELIITQDSAQSFEISADIRGTHAVTKTGFGTLILSGHNTYSDETDLQAGTLVITGGNAIGDTSTVAIGGTVNTTLQLLASETIGRLAGGQRADAADYGVVDIGSHTLTFNQGATNSAYEGVFVGTGTIVMSAGTGQFNYVGSTTTGFTGTVVVNSGLFQLSGASGRLSGVTSFTINNYGNFLIDNDDDSAPNDRISDSAAFVLNSAAGAWNGQNIVRGLAIRSNNDASEPETIGALTFNSGANYATLDASGGNSSVTSIIAASWARQNSATINVRGRSLGAASGANRTQFKIADNAAETAFLASTNLVGGGGTAGGTAKNISIVPWAIGEATAAATASGNMGNSFVTYVDNRGFVALNLTDEYNTYAAAAATDNVRQSLSANLTGLAGKTINSLVLNNAATATVNVSGSGAGQSLAVTSGAMLFTVTGAATNTAYNTVLGGFDGGITVGNTNEYVIFVVDPNPSASLTSGATTLGSTTVTVASTTGLLPGMRISGAGIPSGATVVSVTSATQFVISLPAISSSTNQTYVYSTLESLTATISSPLASAADITKSGRGTLVLSGVNTAGGGTRRTTINEGILEITDLDNIGGNSGQLVFAGGTLRLSSSYSGDDLSLRAISFLLGGGTLDTNGFNLTLGSLGSGAGGFTKAGLGNLTLNAAATYSGATTVSGGTLVIGANNATGTGDINILAGATLDVGSSSLTTGTLTTMGASPAIVGTGTITASGGFVFNHTGNTTIAAVLAGAGGILKQQANTITLTGLNTFTGQIEIQAGTLVFDSVANVGAGPSALGNAGNVEDAIIRMGLGTTATTLAYTGTGHSTDRRIGLQGTTGGAVIQGNGIGAVLFTGGLYGANVGAKVLTLGGTSNSSINNSMGPIQNGAGTLSLIKTDANTWELNGTNTYTGATSVNNGILRLTAAQNMAGALQFGSANSIATTGTLEVKQNASFSSMLVQTNASGTNNLSVDSGKTLTITGNIMLGSGAGSSVTIFAASGDGSFVVSNNTSGIGFQVGNSNTNVAVADFNALGAMNVSLNTTDGILQVSSASGTNNTGFGSLSLAKSTTITASALTVGGAGSYNGNAGQVNVLKLGTTSNVIHVNTLNIGTGIRDLGSVTFYGTTGTVAVRAADGVGAVAFNMGTGIATTQADLSSNQNTFDVTGHQADLKFSAVNIGTQNRNANLLNVFSFDTGTLEIGTLTASSKGSNANTTTTNINIGGGTVTSGAWTLASTTGNGIAVATASFTGGTLTFSGSILRGNDSSGGGTATATVTLNGAVLNMQGNTIGSSTNAVTFNAQSGTLSNLAQLNGGTALNKSTDGTLYMDGTHTYTGVTNVTAGTLHFRKKTALYNNTQSSWTATNLVVSNGATAAFSVGGTDEFAASDIDVVKAIGTAGGGFTNGSFLGLDTTNAAGGEFVYSGVIANTHGGANSVGLTKSGTNTLTLTGTNTYSGATTVAGGTLQVGDGTSGALTGSGSVTVNSGAKLSGSGSIAGSTIIQSGAVLAPGVGNTDASNRTLTFTAAATALQVQDGGQIQLGLTSSTQIDAGFLASGTDAVTYLDSQGGVGGAAYMTTWSQTGNYDSIKLTNGTLTLGDTTGGTIRILNGSTYEMGTIFKLLDWNGLGMGTLLDGGGFDPGALNNLAFATLLDAGLAWDTSAFTKYGVVVVVPEPSRTLLLLLGFAGLLRRRRRR